ncbi:MAG: DUF47 family protein [Saccharofermentanales bacterium]
MTRKKNVDYFDVLITSMSYSYQAALKLEELLNDYTDVTAKAQAIHDLEHAADNECHLLIDALHIAFITPIDREDLYGMIRSIDDITDLIEDASNRFDMFSIAEVRPAAKKMSALIVRATGILKEALCEFKSFKKSKNLHSLITEVNSIEEEGDKVYRQVIKNLFTTNEDTLDIIKWKDIYDDMEDVLDACEDVANIIEGVLLKNN